MPQKVDRSKAAETFKATVDGFRNDVRSLKTAMSFAPPMQRLWLASTLTDTFVFGGIGGISRELAAAERLERKSKADELVHGIDTYNDRIAAEQEQEMDGFFRELSGFQLNELADVSIEDVFGVYKSLYASLVNVQQNNPPKTIYESLDLLKAPNERKRVAETKAALHESLVKEEGNLVKTSLVKAGAESRAARMTADREKRLETMRERALEVYATVRPKAIETVWPTLPVHFQYKVVIMLLNSASRAVGNLRVTADAQAMNPASNAAEEHRQMVNCAEALQVMIQRILASDETGAITRAFAMNRLDPDRHGIDIKPDAGTDPEILEEVSEQSRAA